MKLWDKAVDRRNSASEKWDDLQGVFGSTDVLPLWVADMDFPAPSAAIEALQKRVNHGVFGYTMQSEEYFQAIQGWMQRRQGWKVEKDWIVYCPGVVPALNFAVQAYTEPGDRVIIQTPVYPPFYSVVTDNQRELLLNPLRSEKGSYSMDLEGLRSQMDDRVKMLILCSPHNPVGRTWSRDELVQLADFAKEYHLIVVSDEIHGDLVFEPGAHTPFAAISEDAKQRSIICTAPSKTFNLAGLNTSNIIIPNFSLREKFKKLIHQNHLGSISTFGLTATQAAYEQGDDWLNQCLAYIRENMELVQSFLAERLPGIHTKLPEATYLMWLDFRDLNMEPEELSDFLIHQARLGLNNGSAFGESGAGFMRMNVACSRGTVQEALNRLEQAFAK